MFFATAVVVVVVVVVLVVVVVVLVVVVVVVVLVVVVVVPGCIGSGVTRCLSVLVSLFLVFMLVLEGVWLRRCKNIQCIWGGGAAPSPPTPLQLVFF